MAQSSVKHTISISLQLAEIAQRRLRGPNPLVANNRRLVAVTPTTYKKLEALAKAVSREVGFVVFPMQMAAILIEQAVG